MSSPEVTLLISTFEKPSYLSRALLSIGLQQGVEGKMEVVVTDDGSTDETAAVVEEFARSVDFPVRFTTHPHSGFQVGQCRNEGAAATRAPYLLFIDGDCVLPPDHVALHLRWRQPGVAVTGDCFRLDQETSKRVTEAAIRSGQFVDWAPAGERKRMKSKAFRARIYNLIRHPRRPRLIGNNFGIWRADYERVNGFDETFTGWGLEDTDLQHRLARQGIRFRSIVGRTCTLHLWHPPHATFVPRARGTANETHFHQSGRLACCRNGLTKRDLDQIDFRIVGEKPPCREIGPLLDCCRAANSDRAEVEVLVLPGAGRFSGKADCNILVVLEDSPRARQLGKKADIVISDYELAVDAKRRYRLAECDQALRAVA